MTEPPFWILKFCYHFVIQLPQKHWSTHFYKNRNSVNIEFFVHIKSVEFLTKNTSTEPRQKWLHVELRYIVAVTLSGPGRGEVGGEIDQGSSKDITRVFQFPS